MVLISEEVAIAKFYNHILTAGSHFLYYLNFCITPSDPLTSSFEDTNDWGIGGDSQTHMRI